MPMSALTSHMQASPHTPARPQSLSRSPISPASHVREKERVELLLDINTELLQEMQNLQIQGKGGAPTPEHAALMMKQGINAQMGSEEFVQYVYFDLRLKRASADSLRVMHRVHANLGYLCGASDHAIRPTAKQAPHPPNYVHAPSGMPQLAEKYSKLRALFPGWTGSDGQAVTAAAAVTAPSRASIGTSASPVAGVSMFG